MTKILRYDASGNFADSLENASIFLSQFAIDLGVGCPEVYCRQYLLGNDVVDARFRLGGAVVNDIFDGYDGNDAVYGGTGNDRMAGDRFGANSGADIMRGEDGADVAAGGRGNDTPRSD